MDEKHKFMLARAVSTIKAKRHAAVENANAQKAQDDYFIDTFTASMREVVKAAFDEYAAELKDAGFESHRKGEKGTGPSGVELNGMSFVFASQDQAREKRGALTFRIMPDARNRAATFSYELGSGSVVVMGSVGVNQITKYWIHQQLSEVLEKAGE